VSNGAAGSLVHEPCETLRWLAVPSCCCPPLPSCREVPRSGIAYLSNLAVAPCSRREGIGRKLLREASWLGGCSAAEHALALF
jgi:GNAT superfamily N-acetyltransferase